VCLLYCSRSPESSHMIPVRSGMYCASHLKLEFFRLSESFDSSMDLCICCSLCSSSEMRCCIQSIVAAFKASNLRSTKKSSSDAIHLLNAWYPSVLYGCFFGSLIAGPVVLPGPGKLDTGTGGVYCAPGIIEGWYMGSSDGETTCAIAKLHCSSSRLRSTDNQLLFVRCASHKAVLHEKQTQAVA
jgi:hypothetical protein